MALALSKLGQLLELMHISRDRWGSAAARGIEWRAPALLNDAFMRAMPKRAVARRGRSTDPKLPEEQEETWKLWVRRPSDYRAEFDVGDDRVDVVVKGNWWWNWSPRRGARTNDGRENHGHGLGPGEILFRPAEVIAALLFDAPEVGEDVAGRESLRVSAVPIRDDERTPYDDEGSYVHSRLDGIGSGADEYRFNIDAEVGIILRSEAILDGRPFRILEMTELEIDSALDEKTFRIEPPNGQQFISA